MARSKQDITIEFTREILRVNLAFKQFLQYKFRQHNVDLTFEMLQVLASLWNTDGINQQEIANITVKDKASMTYLIDNLSRRKLVYRQEDEKDRRNKLIFLTPQGKALRQQIQPWVAEMYAVASKDIPVDKISETLKILEKIRDNMREYHE